MNGPRRSTVLRGRAVQAAAIALFGLTADAAFASAEDETARPKRTGRQLFIETCAACHAADGRGHSRSRLGFDVTPPDFTDPDFASREPHADWVGIARNGGPSRGFSEIMPSFRDALSMEELDAVVAYIKSLHDDDRWPPGEFNLPRPLVTGKAYLEDEVVFQAAMTDDADGRDKVTGKIVYEQRFGSLNMWEVVLPFGWNEGITNPLASSSPRWSANIGDAALAVKRNFHHDVGAGSILSGTAELILPTGDQTSGLGKGTFVFEPFLTYGQILPADFFLQAQAGLELPFQRPKAENEVFLRLALGRSINFKPWGRTWSPMVELLTAKELVSGERIVLDIVPQVQVTLNKRQHIMFNIGVRMPLNQTTGRSATGMIYLIWDWFDGAFLDGW
ncbi:MAG: c-type cytochrome [Vicinamibacteria bacterium]|nr:c-type cytochrome [Vicinamibacteria bacterium]